MNFTLTAVFKAFTLHIHGFEVAIKNSFAALNLTSSKAFLQHIMLSVYAIKVALYNYIVVVSL